MANFWVGGNWNQWLTDICIFIRVWRNGYSCFEFGMKLVGFPASFHLKLAWDSMLLNWFEVLFFSSFLKHCYGLQIEVQMQFYVEVEFISSLMWLFDWLLWFHSWRFSDFRSFSMALCNKFGSILKQSFSANAHGSMLNSIRCVASTTKLFIGGTVEAVWVTLIWLCCVM